ncbi:MAG: GDP-mannose-dependent alpha-(1-6)-phosphatidylinositol monomannoside mannosyltransferase [Bacteroidetes bacterium ADurb.Bin408]|nr:MAG: GDP-mannose-dependent alpha-(1-6)-phosphatidylinositol monomannoside mannosyltransferase [Bacteroidetes bacterium ADurb.Bin408]
MIKQLAVVSVNKEKYSETFIHDQIRLLPTSVHLFYGGYLPLFYGNRQSFLPFPASDFGPGVFYAQLFAALAPRFHKKHIAHYCRKQGIEAILAHYGPTGVQMMEISVETGIPLYVYFHGYDAYRAAELAKYGSHYKRLFDVASGIFSVSHEMTERLIGLGAPVHKVIYNPCGADTALFTNHDAGKNPPVILSVGRFDDTKDHLTLITAFQKVQKAHPQALLKIFGTGKNFNACRRLTERLGLTTNVLLPGVATHTEIASEMAQARVFVLHSVTTADGDREGAPVSIMEAGASGLPVVATRHAGINDIVVHGETGFLTEEKDVNALALHLNLLLENPLVASRMGEKAHARINTYFSLKRNVELIWKKINK